MKFSFLIILLFIQNIQFASADVGSGVIEIFEPFSMKTHKTLLKNLGADATKLLYDEYISEKNISDNCEELIGSCEYYLCQEKRNNCGAKGYFLNFGYQYCSDSIKRLSLEVSSRGKDWLETTATCLQKEIQSMNVDQMSCGDIKSAAIKGHDKCYSEISFCSLKFFEITKILKMILPALTERGVFFEGLQVLDHCVSRQYSTNEKR